MSRARLRLRLGPAAGIRLVVCRVPTREREVEVARKFFVVAVSVYAEVEEAPLGRGVG